MKICLAFRQDRRSNGPVECYARSVLYALEKKHDVICVGEGHDIELLEEVNQGDFDMLLEIENGRNSKGKLFFQQGRYHWTIPSAVWLIDSHGQPDLHKAIARDYNHIFFAVWSKRDIFKDHKQAHWCPCATDLRWFDYKNFEDIQVYFDFGFFGSLTGIPRAYPLKEICQRRGWTFDVRQISKPRKHKWPYCGQAMAACKNLFNHGQKHDGPNQRVLESMAMRRPLLTDCSDTLDGMGKLFEHGVHYIGYQSYSYSDLEERCEWVIENPEKAEVIADAGYREVAAKHTIDNRVDFMLEVMEG